MKYRSIPFFFLLVFLNNPFMSYAQELPYEAWLLEPEDSVFVNINSTKSYITHIVKHRHTPYGIKRFYGMSVSDLYMANPELEKSGLRVGQELKIPMDTRAIKRAKPLHFKDTAYVKVYYKVRPKETLWRVAKVHFKMPVEILQKRNNMNSTAIQPGQILHVGWLKRSGISAQQRQYTGLSAVLAASNTKLQKRYDALLLKGKTEVQQEGKACWPKHQNLQQDNSLYVLHSKSPVGSVIKIENPMTGRMLYAKVLGAVPNTPFARGAITMLSPTVAKALGVLDAKIYVKIKYLK